MSDQASEVVCLGDRLEESIEDQVQQDYNAIMASAATDAVKYVNREYQFALDFSEESLEEVESNLSHIHRVLVVENDEPIDPKIVVTLSNWYGAYIGEVFKKYFGGNWGIDRRDPEAPSFQLEYKGNYLSFPSIVFHRIMGGEDYNVSNYYHDAVMGMSS